MKFSVLMSVYFREKAEFIELSLESIFNQTLQPTQLVLVKDGALTPELDAIIDEFKHKHPDVMTVVPLAQNVGLGNALNEGLKYCKHELVARMDSDDICLPNRFELQLNEFKSEPSLSIVGGWISEFVSDPSELTSTRRVPESNEELRHFVKSKNPMNHMTVMFKKSDVLKVGGYQHFYLLEDYWLWGRMMAADKKFMNIQEVLVYVRGGAEMAARRGGIKYAKSEVNLYRNFRKMGLIGVVTMMKNIVIRFTVRMMPNKLRTFIYKKLLRS